MSNLKHIEAVQGFKNALEVMVADGEIRADYGNQLLRLMRSGMPKYATACGFGGGYDFVLRNPARPSLSRREVEAQIRANGGNTPTPAPVQKKSVEHVGGISPTIEVPVTSGRDFYAERVASKYGQEAAESLNAVPSYTIEGLAAEFGITDWEATTVKQADQIRDFARNLGITAGPNSKPLTIAQKIVAAYA